MTKRPFIAKRHRAKKCLELMLTNVFGAFSIHA